MRIGVGKGHGSNTPNLPVIREVETEPLQKVMLSQARLEPGTRAFRMGKCYLLVSPPVEGVQGWHLSISRPDRYPSWDEVAKARYELLPKNLNVVMLLPPPEHENEGKETLDNSTEGVAENDRSITLFEGKKTLAANDDFTGVPTATHSGHFDIGTRKISCSVLEDGTRVIEQGAFLFSSARVE